MTTAELQRVDIQARHRFKPGVRALISIWLRRMATRRQLRSLDGHLLADIGRTEKERQHECAKWFWQK